VEFEKKEVKKRSKGSEITQELIALKSKISELPQKFQTGASVFGAGAGKAQEQIPIICTVIDDAVKALKIGNRHLSDWFQWYLIPMGLSN